jgi:hypothetical protein
MEFTEGQVIALNSHLKERAKTDFNFAMIDQVKGSTIDATFITDAEASGRVINKLEAPGLNLQFFFVYPDLKV